MGRIRRRTFVVIFIGLAVWLYYSRFYPKQFPQPPLFDSLVVFRVNGLHSDTLDRNQLTRVPHYTVPREQCRLISSGCKYQSGEPIWKGSNLGVAQLQDGRECRIALSHYGAFFKVLWEPGYYRCEGPADDAIRQVVNEATLAFTGSHRPVSQNAGTESRPP